MAKIRSLRWYDYGVIETLRSLLNDTDGCRGRGLEEVVAMRALLDRFEAQWLAGLNDVVVSGEAEAAAGVSTTDWLASKTRCTRPEARGRINVAKRLAATALIRDELADGELSLSQVEVLVRARTKRIAEYFDTHETFLVDMAKDLSVDQLAVLVSQWHAGRMLPPPTLMMRTSPLAVNCSSPRSAPPNGRCGAPSRPNRAKSSTKH